MECKERNDFRADALRCKLELVLNGACCECIVKTCKQQAQLIDESAECRYLGPVRAEVDDVNHKITFGVVELHPQSLSIKPRLEHNATRCFGHHHNSLPLPVSDFC